MKTLEEKINDCRIEIDMLVDHKKDIGKKIEAWKQKLYDLLDYQALPEIFTAMSYQHVSVGKFKTYAEAQKYLDRCDMNGYVLKDEKFDEMRFCLVYIDGRIEEKFRTKEEAYERLCRMDPESYNFYEIRED